jgi:hypothetical protein
MSFITESKKAYRQVEILEKENSDHEISMARSELESTADKALAISSMLQSKSDIGNPLEAWVQSKITKAKDYITSVHDYLKYTPGMNESFDLEENTFEKIYQMQQDGKSSEDIAKELKLNPALVKKVLGEQIELKEFTDAQIAALKKEYDPLKGKTITTAQYQQLKNILFKLQDGDLEKLQKQNIPFASTGAGSILRVRKAPVKITSVKVPGLEGMAEENQYVAVHVKKGKTSVTANSSYEAAKKASEKFGLNDTTGITVMLAKKDGEDVIHKATEEVKVTEEKIPQDYLDYLRTIVYKKVDFYEIPPKHIIQHWKDEPNKDRFKGKIIDYKEAIDMSKVTKYKMISIKGDQKEITIDRKDLEKHLKLGYVIKEPLTEKVELQEKPSRKKHVVFKVGDKLVAKDFRGYNDDEIAKSIDDFLKQNSKSIVVQQSPIQSVTEEPKNPYAIGMAAAMKATGDTPPLKKSTITKAHKIADKVKEEEVNKTNTKSDEKRTIDMTDGSAHVRFPKDDTKAMEFYKSKGYKVTTKYEETELEEACWTGYKKVGMKKKGDRMVPNCVPEGYVTESGDIVEFVELNEGQFKEIDTRKGDLKLAKDKKQNLKDKYNAIMAGQATGDENAIADQIQKLEMSIKKQEQELIDIMKKQRETKKEEVSKEKETEFHKKLDTLVHKTFGKRKDEKMPVKESTSRNINEGARALVEAIAALQKKADKSGMPYSILKQVYDRGMAAWKGGHRPGAGQHQWAFARVNSFVTKSSGTWGGADSDLAKKVKGKE